MSQASPNPWLRRGAPCSSSCPAVDLAGECTQFVSKEREQRRETFEGAPKFLPRHLLPMEDASIVDHVHQFFVLGDNLSVEMAQIGSEHPSTLVEIATVEIVAEVVSDLRLVHEAMRVSASQAAILGKTFKSAGAAGADLSGFYVVEQRRPNDLKVTCLLLRVYREHREHREQRGDHRKNASAQRLPSITPVFRAVDLSESQPDENAGRSRQYSYRSLKPGISPHIEPLVARSQVLTQVVQLASGLAVERLKDALAPERPLLVSKVAVGDDRDFRAISFKLDTKGPDLALCDHSICILILDQETKIVRDRAVHRFFPSREPRVVGLAWSALDAGDQSAFNFHLELQLLVVRSSFGLAACPSTVGEEQNDAEERRQSKPKGHRKSHPTERLARPARPYQLGAH